MVLTLVYALVFSAAWTPAFIGPDVDLSWQAVMHHAWLEGWQLGDDLIYTGGPYYFVYTRLFYPGTYPLLVSLTLALTSVQVWAMWRLVRAGTRDGLLGAALVLVVLEVADASPDLYVFLPAALLVLLTCLPAVVPRGGEEEDTLSGRLEGSHEALLHALALALSLLSLTKHTLLATSLIALAAISADAIVRRRRPPLQGLTYLAGVLVFWLLAGQSLGGIPAYLSSTFHIASGYTEAMSLRASPYTEAVACAVAAAFALPWLGLLLWTRRRWASLIPTGGLALLFVVAAKFAFVADGDRAHVPAGLVACVALLMAPTLLAHRRDHPLERKWSQRSRVAACLTLGMIVLATLHARHPVLPNLISRLAALPTRGRAVAQALFDPSQLQRTHQEHLAQVRAFLPLPKLEGSVDMYAPMQAAILAHDLDYQPRPIFQSFQAYSPTLEHLNRDHLLGDEAPDWIVLAFAPVDNRYRALADGPAWPELLTRYRAVRELAPGWLLLAKRKRPLSFSLTPLGEIESPWSRVEVPKVERGHAVWVEMEIDLSLPGRILSLLYKAPRLRITPRTNTEQVGDLLKKQRLIAGMARAGFILSPRIDTPVDFMNLTTESSSAFWSDREVSSIELAIADDFGASWAYRDRVKLRFYELEIER